MEQINEFFGEMGEMLDHILNPIIWAIVIPVSIVTKQYWKPAIAGVITQFACITFLAVFFIYEDGEDFEEAWNFVTVEDFAYLLSASILTGFTISALIFLKVKESRQQQAATANE